MEIQLIMGANGSGKSLFAEQLAVESGEKRVYIATMVPYTEDNHKRIAKHLEQRKGKNFATQEVPVDLDTAAVDSDSIVLLEDASNLLANEIFTRNNGADKVLDDIKTIAQKCKKLIIVSIDGLYGDGFDGETQNYINQLNSLNRKLCDIADTAFIMKDGKAVKIK